MGSGSVTHRPAAGQLRGAHSGEKRGDGRLVFAERTRRRPGTGVLVV